jgi:hypothetical protein
MMQKEHYVTSIITGILIASLLGSTIVISSNTAIALDPTKVKKGIVGILKFKANKDNPLKIPLKDLVHLPHG